MPSYKYLAQTAYGSLNENGHRMSITMPMPPFEIEREDRDITAPRNPPIRGEMSDDARDWLKHIERLAK